MRGPDPLKRLHLEVDEDILKNLHKYSKGLEIPKEILPPEVMPGTLDYERIRLKNGSNYVEYEFEGMDFRPENVFIHFGDRSLCHLLTLSQ